MKCHMCEKEVNRDSSLMAQYRKTGRGYCSKECSSKYRAKISSETMSRTNRRYASARMTSNNPMSRKEPREKMRATLVAMGHAPKVRGGNGRPPTKAELMLYYMLASEGFALQVIETTGPTWRSKGCPNHYKIDCANRELMIAIEADGASHLSLERQEQDARKTECLTGLGWTVLRFTNQEILSNIEAVHTTVMSTISKSKGCTHT